MELETRQLGRGVSKLLLCFVDSMFSRGRNGERRLTKMENVYRRIGPGGAVDFSWSGFSSSFADVGRLCFFFWFRKPWPLEFR